MIDAGTRSLLLQMVKDAGQATAAMRAEPAPGSGMDPATAAISSLTRVSQTAAQLPTTFQASHREIGIRAAQLAPSRLTHLDATTRTDRLRTAVLGDLPKLVSDIERLLAEEPAL